MCEMVIDVDYFCFALRMFEYLLNPGNALIVAVAQDAVGNIVKKFCMPAECFRETTIVTAYMHAGVPSDRDIVNIINLDAILPETVIDSCMWKLPRHLFAVETLLCGACDNCTILQW